MQQERIEKNYTSLCEQEDWTLRSLKPVWNRDARIIYSFPVLGVKKIRRKRYEERVIWESKKKKKRRKGKEGSKQESPFGFDGNVDFTRKSITRTWYLSIHLCLIITCVLSFLSEWKIFLSSFPPFFENRKKYYHITIVLILIYNYNIQRNKQNSPILVSRIILTINYYSMIKRNENPKVDSRLSLLFSF